MDLPDGTGHLMKALNNVPVTKNRIKLGTTVPLPTVKTTPVISLTPALPPQDTMMSITPEISLTPLLPPALTDTEIDTLLDQLASMDNPIGIAPQALPAGTNEDRAQLTVAPVDQDARQDHEDLAQAEEGDHNEDNMVLEELKRLCREMVLTHHISISYS